MFKNILKFLCLIVFFAFLACDKQSQKINESTKTKPKTSQESKFSTSIAKLSGKVMPLLYAQENTLICLDINADDKCQYHTEPVTRTNAQGAFSLAIQNHHAAKPGQIILARTPNQKVYKSVFTQATLINNKKLANKYKNQVIISPLSSLVAAKLEAGENIHQAFDNVAGTLGLSTSDLNLDYLQAIKIAKSHHNEALIQKNLMLIKKSLQISTTLALLKVGTKREIDLKNSLMQAFDGSHKTMNKIINDLDFVGDELKMIIHQINDSIAIMDLNESKMLEQNLAKIHRSLNVIINIVKNAVVKGELAEVQNLIKAKIEAINQGDFSLDEKPKELPSSWHLQSSQDKKASFHINQNQKTINFFLGDTVANLRQSFVIQDNLGRFYSSPDDQIVLKDPDGFILKTQDKLKNNTKITIEDKGEVRAEYVLKSQDFSIDYSFDGNNAAFRENPDGSITGLLTITSNNENFSNNIINNSDFILNEHYKISNIPSGLTAKLTKINKFEVTLSFVGTSFSIRPDMLIKLSLLPASFSHASQVNLDAVKQAAKTIKIQAHLPNVKSINYKNTNVVDQNYDAGDKLLIEFSEPVKLRDFKDDNDKFASTYFSIAGSSANLDNSIIASTGAAFNNDYYTTYTITLKNDNSALQINADDMLSISKGKITDAAGNHSLDNLSFKIPKITKQVKINAISYNVKDAFLQFEGHHLNLLTLEQINNLQLYTTGTDYKISGVYTAKTAAGTARSAAALNAGEFDFNSAKTKLWLKLTTHDATGLNQAGANILGDIANDAKFPAAASVLQGLGLASANGAKIAGLNAVTDKLLQLTIKDNLPKITSVAYDASTATLSLQGVNFASQIAGWDFTKLVLKAAANITLSAHDTSDANRAEGLSASVNSLKIKLHGTLQTGVEAILNTDGTKDKSGNYYRLDAAAGFMTSFASHQSSEHNISVTKTVPLMTSITIANGGTANIIDSGDSIAFAFNNAVDQKFATSTAVSHFIITYTKSTGNFSVYHSSKTNAHKIALFKGKTSYASANASMIASGTWLSSTKLKLVLQTVTVSSGGVVKRQANADWGNSGRKGGTRADLSSIQGISAKTQNDVTPSGNF